MKITIQGQDYTAALDAARPLTIERKLNEPSICELSLSLPANGSPVSYTHLDVYKRQSLPTALAGSAAAGCVEAVIRGRDQGSGIRDQDP